nr:hypothetical protein [Microbacterium bovistercoris]
MTESLVLWVAFAAGWLAIASTSLAREPGRPPVRFTWWALILWLVVAIPSLLQLAVPELLDAGMRNNAVVEQGQWWRIVTANVLQDGGLAGTLSNLSILAVTLLIVGRALPGALALMSFIVGGLASMLLQLSHPGAGNSMATLALVAAAAVITLRRPVRPASLVGVSVLVLIGIALTAIGNEHGPAILIGLAMGAAVRLVMHLRRRRADEKAAEASVTRPAA